MSSKAHWERVYGSRAPDEVSWFQEHAGVSLRLIRDAGVPVSASIIDVGGGASTLVDDLLANGYGKLTVLDLAASALAAAQARLGSRSERVRWLQADVLDSGLAAQAYDLWHDRAVFHFLTRAEDRRRYVQVLRNALRPDGLVIVATFAEDGPTRCSGLPVMRYAPEELAAELGEEFELLRHEREVHRTPAGNEQRFVYCVFRRAATALRRAAGRLRGSPSPDRTRGA